MADLVAATRSSQGEPGAAGSARRESLETAK